jgi:hypothetical protein
MDHIQNPLTGEDVSIYSNEAKQLIKKYIKLIQSGGKRKGKGKGKKGRDRVLKKQKEPNLLIPILVFIKNMMNNPNKSEFEEYMKKNPKVRLDYLKYAKEIFEGQVGRSRASVAKSIIEGPGLEKFILFIFFHLGKYKTQQRGGSSAETELEENSSDAETEPEQAPAPAPAPEPEEESEPESEQGSIHSASGTSSQETKRAEDDGQIVAWEATQNAEDAMLDQAGYELEEYGGNHKLSNTFRKRSIFLWYTLFIGLVASIYKVTDDLFKMELDLKTPIFEALDAAAAADFDEYPHLRELGELVKAVKTDNEVGDNGVGDNAEGDIVGHPFLSYDYDSDIPNEQLWREYIIVEGVNPAPYEIIQEGTPAEIIQEGSPDPVENYSENRIITIDGTEYEFDNLISGYENKPITIGTIWQSLWYGQTDIIESLIVTGLVALGEVKDTIRRKAMTKLKNLPEIMTSAIRERVYNPDSPFTLNAARFYSITTRLNYALSTVTNIGLRELNELAEDITKDVKRYTEDLATVIKRAAKRKILEFTDDVMAYIYLIQVLFGCLATLFLFPAYHKVKEMLTNKDDSVKIQDSILEIENATSSDNPPSMIKN